MTYLAGLTLFLLGLGLGYWLAITRLAEAVNSVYKIMADLTDASKQAAKLTAELLFAYMQSNDEKHTVHKEENLEQTKAQ